VAKRLGPLRWAALALVPLVGLAVAYLSLLRNSSVEPRLVSSVPVAVIGSGSSAVAVADDGTVLAWLRLSEEVRLPQLPLAAPPQAPRVRGPVLEQVRVLAAAPAALRPYLAASRFGESGVEVELSSGIELRFGNAAAVARKWRAAATVLADPQVTSLDYVSLLVPSRPAIGGSGHTLPPIP
jgi:cell division septal protein FtsQ